MPGVGDEEHIVKAPEQDGSLVGDPVVKHPGQLFRQEHFPDAVMVIQRRLGRPADVEGAVHMGFAPLHDLAQLVPVFHLLERQQFHRGAGDDHAVKIPVPDLVKGLVEGQHMFLRGVFRSAPGDFQQFHLDLQGRVAQQPCQLGLRGDLGGHQIQNQQMQGADVLGDGPLLAHDENIFRLQRFGRRQISGNLDRHDELSSLIKKETAAGFLRL